MENDATYTLETVSIEDDDDIAYEEVDIDSDEESIPADENLEQTLRSLKKHQESTEKPKVIEEKAPPVAPNSSIVRRPEPVDDFFRNWLVKMGFDKTMDCFQTEWYEMVYKGKLKKTDIKTMPDVYMINRDLEDTVKYYKAEAERWQKTATELQDSTGKLKKEKDFHRMHHKRVDQEKNKLLGDIEKLQEKLNTLKQQLAEAQKQQESIRKDKMLLQLERDKLARKVAELESGPQVSKRVEVVEPSSPVPTKSNGVTDSTKSKKENKREESPKKKRNPKDSLIPTENRANPWSDLEVPPLTKIGALAPLRNYKAHESAISSLALHPSKNIVATGSDDSTWKMWNIQDGKHIMTGEGHKAWVSSCDFHPKGTHLVTCSGDSTVKIWDFSQGLCTATFEDHKKPVWCCAFHDSGDFVISASMDKTCKLLDLNSLRCRSSLRGHVDSVNSVCFQPFSNTVATCSGDKTVSLWDCRTGLLLQTFYGHMNSCNHVTFNKKGDTLASTDADGIVKIWDIRMVAERATIDTGSYPANKACFDHSSSYIVVPCDDALIRIYDLVNNRHLVDLKGHEDAVHAALLDASGQTLISGGTDGLLHLWT